MPIVLALVLLTLLVACNARLPARLVFACRLKMGFPAPPAQAASLFYQRLLRLLERAGWRKSPSQTPVEFAASLSAGEIAVPVARFTELCMAARFGGERIEASRFTGLLEEIKLSLRGNSRHKPRTFHTE
jgi:hypothetical protein